MKNRTMMQMFEWYLPNDGTHWNTIAGQARELAKNGINMVWLPPAYKGSGGTWDVGYGAYDLYDLGEFDQKGTVRTKYGTREEYLKAIAALKQHGIEVLADIVFNHKMGADDAEIVRAAKMGNGDRYAVQKESREIRAWTRFTFPGRSGKYSSFTWNASHFTGVDYDDAGEGDDRSGIFLFEGKHWDDQVDNENNNSDYLMGADLDLENPEVQQELLSFGKWYYDTIGMDGFRLDAVKHMCAGFYRDWVREMRAYTGKEMFTVGEYWSHELWKLQSYIHQTEGEYSLFDVPLHMNFYQASNSGGYYDMSKILDNTLTMADSWHSVTFVDNHDSQDGQALSSFIQPWFKEIAYAMILLQERGIPCVFYGDYYGIPTQSLTPVHNLRKLIALRNTHAYGEEHLYFDHHDIVGLTREGDSSETGLAMICSDGPGGEKYMYVGVKHAGQIFMDALGNRTEQVTIDESGCASFTVNGGSVSVWIPIPTRNDSVRHSILKWILRKIQRHLFR